MSILQLFTDDATGQLSWGRLSSVVVIVFNLLFSGWSVYKTGSVPDIPSGWLTYALSAYGINKVSSTVTAIKGG